MRNMYLLIYFFIIFISCNKEEGIDIDNSQEEIITATEPCLISGFNIQENSTISINCLLDLEGQIINVPEGVTFEFDGGDIFNGTLNFSSEGKIDGELLNSNLSIEGNVKLTNDTFNFYSYRWKIVETDSNQTLPTQEEAYNNYTTIQETLDFVNLLGATNFHIRKFCCWICNS